MNDTSTTNKPAALAFEREPPDYQPGDRLSVVTSREAFADAQIVELSILWYTTGKGEEDLTVHDFRRVSTEEVDGDSLTLETDLPSSPHSYAGRVVKVCWCARLRTFHASGKQHVVEAPFRLGTVAAAANSDAESPTPHEEPSS